MIKDFFYVMLAVLIVLALIISWYAVIIIFAVLAIYAIIKIISFGKSVKTLNDYKIDNPDLFESLEKRFRPRSMTRD